MSLTSDTKTWLAAKGYTTITSTQMCSISAPWPLFDHTGAARSSPLSSVKNLCGQICDYCPPTTTTSTKTTTTTATNVRKYHIVVYYSEYLLTNV